MSKLTIQNIHKIWGKHVYSKWIENSYGWAVESVEGDSDTYYFALASNGPVKYIEVKLRREPSKYNPNDMDFLYEMWTWNIAEHRWEQAFYSKRDLDTMEGMMLRLGLMIEKILPKRDEDNNK